MAYPPGVGSGFNQPYMQQQGQGQQQQQMLGNQRVPPRPTVPPQGGGGGGGGQVQPPTGIYDVYEQGRQRMLEDTRRGIEGSMAQAGFGGNRYGSSAMNQASEQFARQNLPFQEQFTNMLYNQGQSDLNRQLQATGMSLEHQRALQNMAIQSQLGQGQLGLSASQQYDQMMRARADALLGAGAGQTGRGDTLMGRAYDDYQRNQFGYLPLVQSFLTGAQPGQPPPTTTTSGGGPQTMDYVMQAASIAAMFMMASDRRLKTDIKKTKKKIGPFPIYKYKFKGTKKRGVGPMAQDIEKKYPDAVTTLPGSGYKMINTAVLVNRLAGV